MAVVVVGVGRGRRSDVVVVGSSWSRSGGATGGVSTVAAPAASRCLRSKTRFSSACAVSGSRGAKGGDVVAPIRPAAVTARICGVGPGAGCFEAARGRARSRRAAADRRRLKTRRPTPSPIDLGAAGFSLVSMKLEITPEPTEDERAAIAAALGRRPTPASPAQRPAAARTSPTAVTGAAARPFSSHVRGVHPLQRGPGGRRARLLRPLPLGGSRRGRGGLLPAPRVPALAGRGSPTGAARTASRRRSSTCSRLKSAGALRA